MGGGWWSSVVVLSFMVMGSCGHRCSSSGKQLSRWNALMGVPRQQFGGGTICWSPSPLPSPLSMLVVVVGIVIVVVVVGIVVVSSSVSCCVVVVVVVVSDGGGDG